MSVPRTFRLTLSRGILAALLVFAAPISSVAKGPEPPMRIPLQPLGFQAPGAGALASGGVLSTVHFIDSEHLLVTFNVRRLMKRLSDDPPDDQDRTVEAVVVHLTTGKVLARTNWRVHDPAQYLWDLGHGRFLLRIRDTLTTFAPMVNLESGDPFVEQPFIKTDRRLAVILLSPDRDLITIETVSKAAAAMGDATPGQAGRAQINFYRILQPATPADKVTVQVAGAALAQGLVNLSITAAGYIEVLKESQNRWLFDFDPYVGKFAELSPFDSTCRPHPVFVSSSEFVSFGCMGSSDKLALGGFDLHGEQMWQQNFTDTHAFPNFSLAPAAGRFALSRNIVAATAGITVDFAPSTFTTQEIRVYQTYNGKQLLKLDVSPVQRFGENYDLSDDGLKLAVVKADAIEIYRLPALAPADEAAVKVAKSRIPADAHAMVNLASHVPPVPNAPDKIDGPAGPAFQVRAPSAANPDQMPVAVAPTPAEQEPAEERRKAPTLYTLPDDKPPAKPQ